MSLREWKKMAESKSKAGKMKNQLYNQITAEKIKSKTSDAAITKSFRLDEIIEGLKGKPAAPRVRKRVPVKIEEGVDYAPEVDPYEDMDVEGLLNLEDYVPPQPEKQIAPKPPEYQKYPKYQMDPSYWELDPEEPPAYEDLSIAEDKKAIEAPPDDDDDDDDDDDGGSGSVGEANKILNHLDLPNYDDVQMRLDQPEMTATKQRNYLDKVVKDAEMRRRQVIAFKSDATKKFKKGIINAAERDRIHQNSDKFRLELNDYIKQYKFKSKSYKGYGMQKGRGVNGAGVYFYNDAKELLEKLTLIIGEMEAGNTSIQMRNMGVSILDTLLKSKAINKGQYQKLVKKYFKV